MDCYRLTVIDAHLVTLAATVRTMPLEAEDYLQTMREALCALVSEWQGTDADLVAACQRVAERSRWREQHEQRRRAEWSDDARPAVNAGRSLDTVYKQRQRDYGGSGESVPYTLDLGDMAALTLADWQATMSNLRDRNVLSGDAARHMLLEVSRFPAIEQPVARAILCGFSMRELLKAGYKRALIERVRDRLERLGMAYHLQDVVV